MARELADEPSADIRANGIVTVTRVGRRDGSTRCWWHKAANPIRTTATASPQMLSATPCGCTTCSASACAMWNCFWLSGQTVRRWCRKFGQSFAYGLRCRRPRPGDKWYLDEVFNRIQGVQHYLWRAVDQGGVVLDILVQDRRDAKAAKRFFRRLLMGLQYAPRVISPTNSGAMGWRSATCCPMLSIGRAATSTTAPRIHTDRRDDENGKCNGSNHPAMPRGSSPLMRSSIDTSIHDVT